ncbi:DNA replication protein DnaC [Streptococcus agalactiae]|uniref:DNA replication protein DnaC n=1 Tax=Streptococcus agalactiae TaxID=1311 RepID=A0AB74H3K5_STRAG|nr:conserved phage C-terminal domain-containing protein [Streptococcus agalactiae]SUN28169.1 DNA replication protein DnaC [Streptococcus agalactiae]
MAQKSKTKIYYWLKFDKHFFDNLFIKRLLRNFPGGSEMIVIYIRLMLEAIENDCIIDYEGTFDNYAEELALRLETSEEQINMALAYFVKCGVIQVDDGGNTHYPQAKALLGQETNWNRYKKKQAELEKFQLLSNQVPTEIEIEIEKDKEKERELDKEKEYNVEQSTTEYTFPSWLESEYVEQVKKGNPKNFDYRIPIAYLNQKTNSNYKFVDSNTNLVKSRLKDKYTLDDFKIVIDKKTAEWGKDAGWSKYLRPSTLFNASKFESYLNQPEVKKSYVSDYDEELLF